MRTKRKVIDTLTAESKKVEIHHMKKMVSLTSGAFFVCGHVCWLQQPFAQHVHSERNGVRSRIGGVLGCIPGGILGCQRV